MSIVGTDNFNGSNDANNIVFTIKDTKLYLPVVPKLYLPLALSSIKKYQNFLAKQFKDQFIGMNIKQKLIIKTKQTNLDVLSNQILLE